MSHKASSILFILTLVGIAIVTVSFNIPAQAQSIPTITNEDNCMNCHENLYFLHDTGNWFCIRESPMQCVDCHGGNPKAVTQETAHLRRAAHPVVNEDISKCQECHPAECDKRVEIFDQRAGISQVWVAAPYTPAYSANTVSTTAKAAQVEEQTGGLSMLWAVIPLAVIASLALIIFTIHHILKPIRKEHNP